NVDDLAAYCLGKRKKNSAPAAAGSGNVAVMPPPVRPLTPATPGAAASATLPATLPKAKAVATKASPKGKAAPASSFRPGSTPGDSIISQVLLPASLPTAGGASRWASLADLEPDASPVSAIAPGAPKPLAAAAT